MEMFFCICEYLKISPKEFFDYENKNPSLIREIVSDLNKIDYKYILSIHEIIKRLKK